VAEVHRSRMSLSRRDRVSLRWRAPGHRLTWWFRRRARRCRGAKPLRSRRAPPARDPTAQRGTRSRSWSKVALLRTCSKR